MPHQHPGAARTLCNPPGLVADNSDKRYLARLAQSGLPTIPTVWLPKRQGLKASRAEVVWAEAARAGFPVSERIVVKPVVGAGSRDTVVLPRTQAAALQRFLDVEQPRQALMVQPFLPGIRAGERSLIFIDGAFSHAVNKVPAAGDFRSQPEFGSAVTPHLPSAQERAIAERAVAEAARSLAQPPLFARVDLVELLPGQPALMELELIEPCLYLGFDALHPGAAHRLAAATLQRVHSQVHGRVHGRVHGQGHGQAR